MQIRIEDPPPKKKLRIWTDLKSGPGRAWGAAAPPAPPVVTLMLWSQNHTSFYNGTHHFGPMFSYSVDMEQIRMSQLLKSNEKVSPKVGIERTTSG